MPKYLFPFIAGNLVDLKPHKQQGLQFQNILFHTSLKFEYFLINYILHYKCKIISWIYLNDGTTLFVSFIYLFGF